MRTELNDEAIGERTSACIISRHLTAKVTLTSAISVYRGASYYYYYIKDIKRRCSSCSYLSNNTNSKKKTRVYKDIVRVLSFLRDLIIVFIVVAQRSAD